MKRITLCVDDFGLHAGVNAAVLRLAELGRIGATSCQVAGPAWREGAPQLAALAPGRLDVGLHLDLTECTLDAGVRKPLAALIVGAYARQLDLVRIRAEIVAQLDAFEVAFGRAPDCVDGHRHIHQLPGVREALVDVLAARYPARPPWLRIALPRRGPWAQQLRDPAAASKAWLIGTLGSRRLRQLATARGLGASRHLLGVYDFEGDVAHFSKLLAGWMAEAVTGDVIMCHPSAQPARADDVIGAARSREYEVLAGPVYAELAAAANVSSAPLSRILAGG